MNFAALSNTSNKRIEKLRKARNLNEIVAVLKEIAGSIKTLSVKTDAFVEAISSGRLKTKSLSGVVEATPDVAAKPKLILGPEMQSKYVASLSARTQRTAEVTPVSRPSRQANKEIEFVRDGKSDLDFTPVTELADGDGAAPKRNIRRKASGVAPFKLEKFVKPTTASMVKHNDTLAALFENVEELKFSIQMIEQNFEPSKQRDAALKAVRLLYKAADDRISDAFAALDSLSVKHMPTRMNQTAGAVIKHLRSTIDKSRYRAQHEYCHVANYKDSDVMFSFYIVFLDLKSDSGYVFDKYYVVLTGVVSKNMLTTYINTLPDFKLPGRYALGTEVSSLPPQKINQYVDEFLAQNDVSVDLERQAFPLAKDRIKTSGLDKIPGVKSMYLFDDGLRLTLKPEFSAPEKHKDVAAPVMLMLNRLMGVRGKSKVAYKSIKRGNSAILEFVMLNTSGVSKKLRKSDLSDIQELLGLTDSQVTQIREAQRTID